MRAFFIVKIIKGGAMFSHECKKLSGSDDATILLNEMRMQFNAGR